MGKLVIHLALIGMALLCGYIAHSDIKLDQYKSYFIEFIKMGNLFTKSPEKEAENTINELLSKEKVELIDVIHDDPSLPKTTSNIQFSVLSYNVLADSYSDLFAKDAGDTYINYLYRFKIVLEEIKRFNADILFLQEIDKYDEFYLPNLNSLGYELVKGQRDKKQDSAVVGYKKDVFELIETKIIDFNVGHKYEKNNDFIRNNVAVVLQLKHKSSGKILHVMGTHFFWSPKKEHVKYLQMAEVVRYFAQNNKDDDIIVWGGDLNSKPGDNNIAYLRERAQPTQERIEFYTEKMLNYQLEMFKDLEIVPNQHTWGNVYQLYGQSTGVKDRQFPKYTNYTKKFKEVLDHILYNKKALIPKKLLTVPDEKTIGDESTPNRRYPSDHLPIMTVFEII